MRKNYAVIAAGGLGTRLKNFKDNLHTKVLIDIDGMSMISTQINQLKSWGFLDFIVITNPDFHDLIVNDIKQNHRNLNISFVVQDQPKGIAHALSFAESKVDDDSLVTFILGDNFFGENPLEGIDLKNFKGSQIFAINVNNPDEFGVMELDGDNNLINIHEKPKEFRSSLAVVGIYIYEKTQLSDRSSLIFLLIYIFQLGALIYLTGGVVNPFIIFLLIPSVFASSNLSLRTNLLLVITTIF